MNASNRPAHEIRLGALKASIWRNETDTGPRFNTTFVRIYRDGEQWKTTDSFGREELLLLAKLADLSHTWIYAQGRESAGGGSGGAAGAAAGPSGPASSAPNATAGAAGRTAGASGRGR